MSVVAFLATYVPVTRSVATAATLQSISRDMIRAASEYANAGDYEAAKRLLEATLKIKPGQVAYYRYLVIFALRANRTDDAFKALESLASSGLVLDLSAFSETLHRASATRYKTVSERIYANAQPKGTAERFAEINAPDALIEGVVLDRETGRLFVSSVAERKILLIEPGAHDEPVVFAGAENGLWSVFGLAVDRQNKILWATSGVVPQTPIAADEASGTGLFAFHLDSGKLQRRYEIEDAQHIADLVVGDNKVYLSDSRAPRIYALDGITDELRTLVEDERFVSLQGLALTRGALYVADYSLGLWRIDLKDHAVTLVSPSAESLIGIDGLSATEDGRLIAVRNGVTPHQVMAIDLDPEGRRVEGIEVLLRGHADMGDNTEPTLIDVVGKQALLVANGAWPLFPEDGAKPASDRPTTIILRIDLQ